MGNILPVPCVGHRCRHKEVNELEAAGTSAKKRRGKQQQRSADRTSWNVWAARPRHAVVPVVDAPEDGVVGREKEAWAWPECRVEPAAGHAEDGGLRVRIVMKRKDIAQLVATLEQRGAEVVSTELAGCNGTMTTMSPCRDAWRPRLSVIPENF